MRRLPALVVVVVAMTACAVAADEAPRDIEPNRLEGAVETEAIGANLRAAGTERIFLVVDLPGLPTRIEAVARDVGDDLGARTAALLAGPTADEFIDQFRSAIPAGLTVRSVRRVGPRVTVDVSNEVQALSGDSLVLALAQIVYTMSDINGVSSVDITVEGEPARWPTSTGQFQDAPLTVFDYPNIEFTRQPAYPSTPSE
jgi:spore germination protein GerM